MSKEMKPIENLPVLVNAVTNASNIADVLASLVDKIPEVPTAELVTSFIAANNYASKIKEFVDAAKKELVTNETDDYDAFGRFIVEGTQKPEEDKGHLYLTGINGEELKAEKRVSTNFDVDKAREYLEKKKKTKQGSDVVYTVENIDIKYKEAFAIFDMLCSYEEDMAQPDCDIVEIPIGKLRRVMEFIEQLFVTSYVPNQEKIEALVTLGKIPVKDVEQLMKTSVTYAVKEVKKKAPAKTKKK